MRITSKGQVTIPQDIREKLGLLPETDVEFDIVGNTVRIRKATAAARRGGRIAETLRGKADAGWTTDQIMALTRGARSK
jgi:AbrB family looped-hinge helix DNA binding protein